VITPQARHAIASAGTACEQALTPPKRKTLKRSTFVSRHRNIAVYCATAVDARRVRSQPLRDYPCGP
jgi:hypothetical protein